MPPPGVGRFCAPAATFDRAARFTAMLSAAEATVRLHAYRLLAEARAPYDRAIPRMCPGTCRTYNDWTWNGGDVLQTYDVVPRQLDGYCALLLDVRTRCRKTVDGWIAVGGPAGAAMTDLVQKLIVPFEAAVDAYVARVAAVKRALTGALQQAVGGKHESLASRDTLLFALLKAELVALETQHMQYERACTAFDAYDPLADFMPDWQRVRVRTHESLLLLMQAAEAVREPPHYSGKDA